MQPQLPTSLFGPKPRAPMPVNASHLGATWNKAYKKLLDFAGKQGHLRVPETLAVDGVPLSKWKSNQISRYRNKTLSQEKIRLL